MRILLEECGNFGGIDFGEKFEFLVGEDVVVIFPEEEFLPHQQVHLIGHDLNHLLNTYIKGLI